MIKYFKQPQKTFNDIEKILYPESGTKEIRQITFQITENCCLACTYCYQHKKSSHSMTFQTAKDFIDILLSDKFERINTSNTFGLVVDFIGGEPLMEIDLICEIWEYLILELIKRNHPWQYHIRGSICSNGILYFNSNVQNFLQKYSPMFSLCFSIDGNKELHDACRIDLNGNGSYDRALAAAHHYQKVYNAGAMPPIKMTLAPSNIEYTYDAILNLINEGYTEIYLNCVFEKGWELSHAQILYSEMIKISDYLIDTRLNEKIYISLFDELFFQPMESHENDNWCGGTEDVMLSLNYKGEYYTCIRYMESSLNDKQKPLRLGSIQDGYLKLQSDIDNYNLLQNITRKSQSTDECFNCSIAKGCAWCSGYNYEEFGTPNKRATYICLMHKARALGNVYFWNKIYNKYKSNKKFINFVSPEDQLKIAGEIIE